MDAHRTIPGAALAVALALTAGACSTGGLVDNSCRVIVGVTPGTSAIGVGDVDTLRASVVNTCGSVSDPGVTWLVSDTTVAAVQLEWPTGLVLGGRAVGTTQVRATARADTTAGVTAVVYVR